MQIGQHQQRQCHQLQQIRIIFEALEVEDRIQREHHHNEEGAAAIDHAQADQPADHEATAERRHRQRVSCPVGCGENSEPDTRDPSRQRWMLAIAELEFLPPGEGFRDVHMNVAEAVAGGQKFQFGYGKHPPLAGWVAGVWFGVFPAANWATYALAMATLGCGLVICWLISLRVVDRRRAFFVVVMLALYPIFNFKGFKYNPDLLQLVTLPL